MFIQTKENEILNVPELDMTNLITKIELSSEGDQHRILITATYNQGLPPGVSVDARIRTIEFETKDFAELAFIRIIKVTCGVVTSAPFWYNPDMSRYNPDLSHFYNSHHPNHEEENKKNVITDDAPQQL